MTTSGRSERERVERALRESEARFREMADGLPLIVWVHDAAGRQEHVNATFREFFGLEDGEMDAERWRTLLHPDDAEAYISAFERAVREQREFHAEARVRRADGRWRWLESWGRPRRVDGEFGGFIGASADITERKRMEDALRDSEARFRTLADNMAQLAWMADGAGDVFWYNERWYEYTGTSLDEMRGWGWRRVHHPDHADRVLSKVAECFRTGRVWEDTFPLRGADGNYRWFLSRALPIRDEHGAVVRWFGTNTDITEQRAVEERLLQSDRQKDEFLAMLGHELRNPLAAIRTAAELLELHAARDPQLAQTHAVLERQTARMAKLLDGLLEVSRMLRGKIQIERDTVDLVEICREAAAEAAGRVADRPLEVRTELPSAQIWIEGDRVRLQQIVDNLLSNATKYTRNGGVVTLSLRSEEDAALLTVTDTGVGIDAALLPHVFDPFRQAEQGLARADGGLGVGLSLVKSLVELHGGTAGAASAGPGQGAEFVIRLPRAEADAPPPAVAEPVAAGGRRLLVIEDNDDAAELLRQVLELRGHEVRVASRGSEGLALARSMVPDVVLCDLGLPDDMDGFDVARELRADTRIAGIRLVALSGYGRPEDKARAFQAGFDAHLTKPVDMRTLEQTLAGLPSPPASTGNGP